MEHGVLVASDADVTQEHLLDGLVSSVRVLRDRRLLLPSPPGIDRVTAG